MKFWQFKNQVDNNDTELLLYGDIADSAYWGDIGAKEFVIDLAKISSDNITVRINSGGGSVFAGIGMYNALKQHKAKITTRVDGLAASAASIVAMAGDDIIMSTGSLLMIHNAWTYTAGNADELREQADTLDKIDESIVAIYKTKTGLDDKKIANLMSKDTWMTANEAKEMGFATHTEDLNISASLEGNNLVFNGVKFNYDKLPKNGLKISNDVGVKNSNLEKEVIMTWEEVKAKFPNEVKALEDTAFQNGVSSEKERLKEIDDLGINGHNDLVISAKYGEKTVNAGILAMNVLKAEKDAKAKMLNSIEEDAKEIVTPPVSEDNIEQTEEVQNKAKISKFADIAAKAVNNIKRGV